MMLQVKRPYIIVVYNVSAECGGALSILTTLYDSFRDNADGRISWHFVTGKSLLDNDINISIHEYPWVKNSKLHRLVFEVFVAPAIIRKLNADVVLSLESTCVSWVHNKQVVYVHQSIPLGDLKFKLFEEPMIWFYKNILGKQILWSIKKAQKVIVQTTWMKEAAIQKTGVLSGKVIIIPPTIRQTDKKFIDVSVNRKRFFYPAFMGSYKNHKVIVDALKVLNKQGITDIEVILTIDRPKNSSIFNGELPIRFVGTLPFEEVMNYYSKSVLLFPSLLESYGLPLIEARSVGAPIIASDLPFSREVLTGYENCIYFDPFDAYDLAKTMIDVRGHSISQPLSVKDGLDECSWCEDVKSLLYNMASNGDS